MMRKSLMISLSFAYLAFFSTAGISTAETLEELNAALAARPDMTQALFVLGKAYEQGVSVPKDEARAAELYRQSWKNGNQEAYERLTAMYGAAVTDAKLTPEERSRMAKPKPSPSPTPPASDYKPGYLHDFGITNQGALDQMNQVLSEMDKAEGRTRSRSVAEPELLQLCLAAGFESSSCSRLDEQFRIDEDAYWAFLAGALDMYYYDGWCADMGFTGTECQKLTDFLASETYLGKTASDDDLRGIIAKKTGSGGSLVRAAKRFVIAGRRNAPKVDPPEPAAAPGQTATGSAAAVVAAESKSPVVAAEPKSPSAPAADNAGQKEQDYVDEGVRKLKALRAKAEESRKLKGKQAPSRALRETKAVPTATIAGPGTPHALVIGINSYKKINKLENAVNDARDVAKLLADDYGFKTRIILEEQATRDNIMVALNDYRKLLGENDSLLIYYSGHGEFNKATETSYWLPVDADMDDTTRWLESRAISDQLKLMASRQVLIVADSCFSGTITRRADTSLTDGRLRTDFLEKMKSKPARVLIASGGNEPVTDGGAKGHSIFADAFMKALKSPFENRFTAEELLARQLKESVAGRTEQTPEFKVIRNSGHDGGDFVFVKMKN